LKKYKLGLLIGRFQPFHLGHLRAVQYAASKCEKLVIGIGSAQESGTERNPFDAETRKNMILQSLIEVHTDVSKIDFIKIPDFMDDEKWYTYIKSQIKDIDIVFSGNPWVKRIFKTRGIKVVTPPWYNRGEISGTKVRSLIRNGEKWEGLVPHAVIGIINQHKSEVEPPIN